MLDFKPFHAHWHRSTGGGQFANVVRVNQGSGGGGGGVAGSTVGGGEGKAGSSEGGAAAEGEGKTVEGGGGVDGDIVGALGGVALESGGAGGAEGGGSADDPTLSASPLRHGSVRTGRRVVVAKRGRPKTSCTVTPVAACRIPGGMDIHYFALTHGDALTTAEPRCTDTCPETGVPLWTQAAHGVYRKAKGGVATAKGVREQKKGGGGGRGGYKAPMQAGGFVVSGRGGGAGAVGAAVGVGGGMKVQTSKGPPSTKDAPPAAGASAESWKATSESQPW
jgi:hypothetical protein